MERPPLLFLYPSLRRSTSHSYLLRPLRPRPYSIFPLSRTRQSLPVLRPHPRHRLPIRHTTTTTTTHTSPPSLSPPYLRRLRRLTPSIPTLTLLTLTYLLYSVSYTLMPVTGASMSPLLNPPTSPFSARQRRDWVWVENWPGRLIRFEDPELNPASSYDGDDREETVEARGGVPWRKIAYPLRNDRERRGVKYDGPRGLIKRGLVVALYAPSSPRGEEGKLLVKRIIALPGDVVTPRPGAKYPRDRVLVPEGSVWVEGDNEPGERSWDSNFFGPVGVGMLVGRVGWRVWPLGRWGALEEEVGEGEGRGRERVVEGGGRRVRMWSGGGGDDGEGRGMG